MPILYRLALILWAFLTWPWLVASDKSADTSIAFLFISRQMFLAHLALALFHYQCQHVQVPSRTHFPISKHLMDVMGLLGRNHKHQGNISLLDTAFGTHQLVHVNMMLCIRGCDSATRNSITARCFNLFSMGVAILLSAVLIHHVSDGCSCISQQ